MERIAARALDHWMACDERQPLVIRGARQVGKTWLVRDLAARHGLDLVECNFERDPLLRACFRESAPRAILSELAIALNRRIDPDRTLLFLDEIQAASEAFARLRWFAEELPRLPVVAAGSLLELSLGQAAFSVPVGRVTYLYLEPLSFPEFLLAHGQEALAERLGEWRPAEPLSGVAQSSARKWFSRYAMVGE